MSETLDSMIKTAKEAYAFNKEAAKEAYAFNKEAAKEAYELTKEAHAINKELFEAGLEDADALIRELSDDPQSAE